MKKNSGLNSKFGLLFFVIVLVGSLTACGIEEMKLNQTTLTGGSNNTSESDNPVDAESNTDDSENRDSRTVESNTDEQEVKSDEDVSVATMKYAVNPKNYKIYAIEEDAVGENDAESATNSGTDTETSGQHNEAEEEKIALLTFDDTPTAEATAQILDTLDKYEAKAIFFVNGHYAERNVETLLEIKNRGHLIGNHTWWHIYIRKESPEKVREEIVRLNDFIEEQLGERPKFFRPPFGQNSDVSLQVIREEGMQSMNWSNGSLDWELKSSDAIVEQVLSNMSNGDNILFHDKQITADALEPILKELSAQGYQFVLPTEVIVPKD